MPKIILLLVGMLIVAACKPVPHIVVGPNGKTGELLFETSQGRIIRMAEGHVIIELEPLEALQKRTVKERQLAREAIRAFVDDAELQLSYRGKGRYAENSSMAVEIYKVPNGHFIVQIPENLVVQMIVAHDEARARQSALLPTELEMLARQFAAAHNSCFAQVESQLRFSRNSKGVDSDLQNYFFRWQSPGKNSERPWNQPTFLQIGIREDGEIFGYTDAGICQR